MAPKPATAATQPQNPTRSGLRSSSKELQAAPPSAPRRAPVNSIPEFTNLDSSLSSIGDESIRDETAPIVTFDSVDDKAAALTAVMESVSQTLDTGSSALADKPKKVATDPGKELHRKLAKTNNSSAAQTVPISASVVAASKTLTDTTSATNTNTTLTELAKDMTPPKEQHHAKGKERNPTETPNPFPTLQQASALSTSPSIVRVPQSTPRPTSPKRPEVIYTNAGQRGLGGRPRSPSPQPPTKDQVAVFALRPKALLS
uniref:Uncharacterized protein n=1 Tax=Mycena chlorophos TaxID=658473 RepID=A0ABQ0L3X8_MYCCL|nr:predicted protein [Mycena chlorophos]